MEETEETKVNRHVTSWKFAVPERCRSFIWLLKHDRLLINYSKSKKGLGNAGCMLCGNVCETTIHVLRDCTKCMQVWKSLVSSAIMEEFFTVDLQSWIELNLNFCGIGNKDRSSVWATACHALWLWGNKEEHDDSYERAYDPILHILQRIYDYENAQNLYEKMKGVKSGNRNMGWKSPAYSMVKLNSDCASKANNVAGCGGVVRDHRGVLKIEFSKYLESCSAIFVEFWSLFEGLKMTKILRYDESEAKCRFYHGGEGD